MLWLATALVITGIADLVYATYSYFFKSYFTYLCCICVAYLPASFQLLSVFVSLAPPSDKGMWNSAPLLLKAPCSNSMVILLFNRSSASCLPSNKHHSWLAILLVTWKRTRDQWQGCCHGTVYSYWVEFCCKARESQSLPDSLHCNCNLLCLVASKAKHNRAEASQLISRCRGIAVVSSYIYFHNHNIF